MINDKSKYVEAVEKQQAENYMKSMRSKTLQQLKNERQKILDDIISFELYYDELNREMSRALRSENWNAVIPIRQKFIEYSEDKVELIQFDLVINEKERLNKFKIV